LKKRIPFVERERGYGVTGYLKMRYTFMGKMINER
jgi:hypothetical protein